MQEDDLGGAGAQQTGLQLGGSGRIDACETQGGRVQMEGVVEGPGGFLGVSHEPVLRLPVGKGEVIDALLQDGAVGVPAPGELDDVTGVPRRVPFRPLESADQRRRPDLSLRQSLVQRLAGGNELRLPGDPVLAVRQVVPAWIGGEVGVLADVGDELTRFAVVETDAPPGSLAATDGVLPPLVSIHPVVAGFRHVAGDPRPAGRTQERHAFGPLRNGEQIGGGQQVIQEYLQAPVDQRGTRDIAFLPARSPQALVHLHVEQIGPGDAVRPDAPDGSEERTVLEGLAQDRFEALVEVAIVREIRGSEAGGVDIRQPARHARDAVLAGRTNLAAAVQLALAVDVVRSGRYRERELARGVGDRPQGRLQPHGRFGDGTGLEELDHFEVDRTPSESLQDQLHVAGRRHDRGVVDTVVRQPREVPFREPGFEQQMLGGNPVPHQRTV